MTKYRKGDTVRYLGGEDPKHRGEQAHVIGIERIKVMHIDGTMTEDDFVKIMFRDGKEITARSWTLVLLDPF